MSVTKRIRLAVGLALLALSTMLSPTLASNSVNFDNAAFATVSGLTSIPIGHAEFCGTHASECTLNNRIEDATHLTESNWTQLLEVNASQNAMIIPVTDQDLYRTEEFWTYPSGYGDCEDYVLAKRRQLIDLGWHPSTLLITVVREANGGGHAVLMVRTDRGDLVLDNQESLIKVWNQTPYQYVKRQSQSHAGQWVGISDLRPVAQIASL